MTNNILVTSVHVAEHDSSLLSQVKILQATGLPRHLSNFVFCLYHFWGQEEPVFVAPEVAPSSSSSASTDPQCTVVFDSAKVKTDKVKDKTTAGRQLSPKGRTSLYPLFIFLQEISVPVSEDFVDFLAEGSVAMEVYGHKQANHRRNLALWDLGVIQAKTRSLRERSIAQTLFTLNTTEQHKHTRTLITWTRGIKSRKTRWTKKTYTLSSQCSHSLDICDAKLRRAV